MEAGRFAKRILISAFLILVLFFSLRASLLNASQPVKSFILKIQANVISTSVESVDVQEINGYSRVQIRGLSNYGKPGEPLLPYTTVKFLLPYGKDIDEVELGWMSRKTIYGSYYVEPAQQPYPLSFKGAVKRTTPDPAVYSSTNAFPGKQYELVSVQNLRGYKIAIINLFPVEYIPATGQLAYYENMTLNLKLKTSGDSLPYDTYRGLEKDKQLVSESVDNLDAVRSYPVTNAVPLAAVDYLIIASSDFVDYAGANSLAVLAAHKTAKWGLTTAIVKTSDIYANAAFDGLDDQDEIRNCIAYYYTTFGTEYVLLVGDSDGDFTGIPSFQTGETQPWNSSNRLPHRGLYGKVCSTTDTNIPADLYYACLGDPYDNDGDLIYGETTDGIGGADVDLLAEVYVGRAPVDSTTELANFVRKTIAYEDSTGSYRTRVLMAGEQLDSITYGGDGLDELINGSSVGGYTTRGMASTGFFGFEKLYDKISDWTTSELVTKLNSGIHIFNHVGHALNALLCKTFFNNDADTLTNTDYFFGYTSGCYSGAFDNCNCSGTYLDGDDCILEHLTTGSNGAVAFVGNSRYGWYSPGTTDGPSQRFAREFWDAVVYEGKTNMGKALQDSKEDNIGLVGVDGAHRWTYFTSNLIGDPQTEIQGEYLAPTDFSAANVCVANKSWVSIRWVNSNYPSLTHTMIRYRTDGVYPTSSTDGTLLVERTAVRGATELFNHIDVENGKTYNYVAFGYDGSTYEGNNGVNNRAVVTVVGGSGGTSTGRSDCFIATVCYGSKNSHEVKILRKFRDKVLVNTYSGKKCISLYYALGPKLARWINNKEALKKIVRKCLDLVAGCAESLMGGN